MNRRRSTSTEKTPDPKAILRSKSTRFRERIRLARPIARPSPQTAGWYCRYFVRHFSIYFSYFLARWGVPANAITCAMFAVGLGGSVCMVPRHLAWNIAGALLWQLEYILDCVDGEVARLHGTHSKLGKYLDYATHVFVNSTVILSLGLHVCLQDPSKLNVAVMLVAYSAWHWKRQLQQLGPLAAEKNMKKELSRSQSKPAGPRSALSIVRLVLVTCFGELTVILLVSAIILLSHLLGFGMAKWSLYLYTPALLFYVGVYFLRDVRLVRRVDLRERHQGQS